MMEINLPLEPTDYYVVGRCENWIPITEKSVIGIEPDRYLISDFGRAFDLKRNCRCKEYDFGGYKTIGLNTKTGNKTYLVHRIVMIEFIGIHPIPEYNVVNHNNGVKYCCVLENLEWATESENVNHAFDTGLNTNVGENAYMAKMTELDALNIMYQLRDHVPIKKIIETVPSYISNPAATIYSIKNGKSWVRTAKAHGIVFADYEDLSERYTEDEKEIIGQLLQKNMQYKDVLRGLGYDVDNMSKEELIAHNRSISNIRCGTASPYIAEKYGLKEACKHPADAVFTEDQLHLACKIYQNGFVSYNDTLRQMGLEPDSMSKDERFRYVNCLSALKRKKIYANITSKYNF